MTNLNENLIINNVLAGDKDAFAILVDRYQDMAYTIAVRILHDPDEAADVVQESFIKSYEVLDSFRGDAKFSSWIYRIVYRKALDRLKSIKRRRTDAIDPVKEGTMMAEDAENAFQQLMKAERREMVKNAISQLKPDEQTLILLYYFEESSIKEITEVLGLGMENVKVKLFRTRKKLFHLLKGQVDHIKVES
ncbi:sigma-70 family RNA polymerase sigma factor [Robertkochia marina]|uniref:Sigma-70 family RNA polymerase sigma factor n=1 Tax=Robertkochia marina TaxID=1227945 RepID=A0A4S3LXY3_9FLAO|nr:sigma-70 family RNA polymerase sigma factor [Robertkochia marina]THD65781.1 sigma-70 family RNA polymerase sigma factor [Robertkochia marina]TRZ46535.1 sigma-70 family RNA polymerase sigma factor [Robertkochia marina]